MLPNQYLPELHSNFADPDALFGFIFWLNVIFFVIILVPTVAFFIVYRHKGGKKTLTPGITHNTALEIFWTVVPTIIIFFIFWWGFKGYMHYWMAPKTSYVINVTARQWGWNFHYDSPSGETVTTTDLIIPVDQPVQLIMTSDDTIHSLYIPDFRVKMDVLPRRKTDLWFIAKTVTGAFSEDTRNNVQPMQNPGPGSAPDYFFDLFCTEYCGTAHSIMYAKVHVLPREDFDAWIEKQSKPTGTPWEIGEKLYADLTCNTCHSVDGSPLIGPSWLGGFGTERVLTDGSTVHMDRDYIRESILNPKAKIAQGFEAKMNPFQLSDSQINSLTAYIAYLNKEATPFKPEDWMAGEELKTYLDSIGGGATSDTATPSPAPSGDTQSTNPTEEAPSATEGH